VSLPRIASRVSRGGLVLAVYAALLLAGSLLFPWWRMENRAPQYGKRVLVVEVSPLQVDGDVKEIDTLGHYVGIRSMETFALLERAAAPFVFGATILAAAVLIQRGGGLEEAAGEAAVPATHATGGP